MLRLLESQSLIPIVSEILDLGKLTISPELVKKGTQTWNAWTSLTDSQDHVRNTVTIALVGKYTDHPDSYHSVVKSLEHAAMACGRKLNLVLVDSENLRQAGDEWERFWFLDQPSHMTPWRTHGGLGP